MESGAHMTGQIWYEDFVPGTELTSQMRRITIRDIDDFAALTGERHPVHMDDAFAQAAGFKGRIAHGMFGLALIEGLKSGLQLFERSVIASLGWNKVRFLAPLEPGDEVRLRLLFTDRRMTSKPGRGLARERGILEKSDGTVVTTGDHLVLILCRPQGAEAQ